MTKNFTISDDIVVLIENVDLTLENADLAIKTISKIRNLATTSENQNIIWNMLQITYLQGIILIFFHNLMKNNAENCRAVLNSDIGLKFLIFVLNDDNCRTDDLCQNLVWEILKNLLVCYTAKNLIKRVLQTDEVVHENEYFNESQGLILKVTLEMLLSDEVNIDFKSIEYFCGLLKLMLKLEKSTFKESIPCSAELHVQLPDAFFNLKYLEYAVLITKIISKSLETLSEDLRRLLIINYTLMESLMWFLYWMDKLQSKATLVVPSEKKPFDSVLFLLKRDIIKALCFLTSNDNSEVQDEVRRLGFLPLILNQCQIDDHNPYVKEYSILLIKNLTNNNAKNQEFISNLTPVSVSQNTTLPPTFNMKIDSHN
ncbi:copper transport protein [Lobulomyces angularis]|nr:copper transport protein [Lobulomyces angularis]